MRSVRASAVAGATPGYQSGSIQTTDVRVASLSRYAEPALVFLLMVAASAVLVTMARRVLGGGAPGRVATSRVGVAQGRYRGPGQAGGGGAHAGSEGAAEGLSRLVPFPPSAAEAPEWESGAESGALRLGHGGAARRIPAAEGSVARGSMEVPPRLDEIAKREPTQEPAVARAPSGRMALVQDRGGAAAGGGGGDQVRIPTPKVGPPVAVEAPVEVRPAVTRLKLTCSAVPTVAGSGSMAGFRGGPRP